MTPAGNSRLDLIRIFCTQVDGVMYLYSMFSRGFMDSEEFLGLRNSKT